MGKYGQVLRRGVGGGGGRGRGRVRRAFASAAGGAAVLGVAGCSRAYVKSVPLPVKEGSYGMAALKRRFNDLDLDRKGTINESDMKEALIKLQLPTSEESIQNFFKEVTGHAGPPYEIHFDEFAKFAVLREKELLQTFNMMDTQGYGFISEDDLAKVLNYMNYRDISKREVRSMLKRIKTGKGPFSKGGGLLGESNEEFKIAGKAIDFAEFRDFMLLTSARDMRDMFEVWGRAVVDLGDVDVSMPMSSGLYMKMKGETVKRTNKSVAKHLFAGAVSGGVSRSVVAPLERVKIEYMVNSLKAKQEGFVGTLARIVKNEGPFGLFKGNSLNVARIAPTKAVEFFVFDRIKDFIINNTDEIEINAWQRMLGGSIASMAGTALTHPIDTVRSRVTVQTIGIGECVQQMLKTEGPVAFLNGLIPNMVRVAPYGAINFLVYDQLKSWYRKKIGPGGSLGAVPTMIFGAAAGAAAQTTVFPIEMVQRRLQLQGMAGGEILYKNMLDALIQISRKEGIPALYAGLLPNYLKLIPAAAISFLVYEQLKERMQLN
ncbi:mitochondrial carrier protein [Chloropicon primus]|nr:mitochondrial carrier protein [Chloropicon primus]